MSQVADIPVGGAGSPENAADLMSSAFDIFHGYIGVFAVAFVVSMAATPIMRRLAVVYGIVDRPNDPRKIHRMPVAYLGGLAVFVGIMSAIFYATVATQMPGLIEFHPTDHNVISRDRIIPLSILFGMAIIALLGLLDDVVGISPRLKISGQLFAAAALAYQDVGVRVAAGVLMPTARLLGIPSVEIGGNETLGLVYNFESALPLLGTSIEFDLVYWAGAILIAIFVLGACNASNLIDGLDGLLTGVTSICAAGLLILAVLMAEGDDGVRDSQRIILCMALLGACLGFLPHNFNPASIFLGDCGSMLMGFTTIVIILTLGDTGQTHLVVAGLVIYAIPLIDTLLAIIRRKLSGKSISDADSDHLHHMLKRSLGVRGAVLALYAIGIGFAVLGIAASMGRARLIYTLALVFAAYIGVTAIKLARREQIEKHALEHEAKRGFAFVPDASEPGDADDEDGDGTPASGAATG